MQGGIGGITKEGIIMKQEKALNCRRALFAAMIALVMACSFALVGCGQSADEGSSASSSAGAVAVDQDRMNAKTVIRGASDLFTMMDLGLTDEDSGAVISMGDPAYQEFFEELQGLEGVSDMEVTDASFTVEITAVEAATARGSQVNYRFSIEEATVVVDGKTATYTGRDGLVVE